MRRVFSAAMLAAGIILWGMGQMNAGVLQGAFPTPGGSHHGAFG